MRKNRKQSRKREKGEKRKSKNVNNSVWQQQEKHRKQSVGRNLPNSLLYLSLQYNNRTNLGQLLCNLLYLCQPHCTLLYLSLPQHGGPLPTTLQPQGQQYISFQTLELSIDNVSHPLPIIPLPKSHWSFHPRNESSDDDVIAEEQPQAISELKADNYALRARLQKLHKRLTIACKNNKLLSVVICAFMHP